MSFLEALQLLVSSWLFVSEQAGGERESMYDVFVFVFVNWRFYMLCYVMLLLGTTSEENM